MTFIFCFPSKRQAIISLPENTYDLVLETTSGDIYSEININKADLNTRSGDIELNNIKNANIKVTSGDIKINEVDDLNIKTTIGHLIGNNMEIKISIIVPCFGVESFLDRCMESLLGQKLKEIEVILIDENNIPVGIIHVHDLLREGVA